MMSQTSNFSSFREFYPYYLSQHDNRLCRRMHFLGTSSALAALVQMIEARNPWWALLALISAYGCAWIGHYKFEKNRPATFSHPFYSLCGDWVMYWQMLSGKLSW